MLIGDSCIDRYFYGTSERICSEAPVPVFNLERVEQKTGMVWNVFRNLISLGADVWIRTGDPTFITKTRVIDTRYHQMLLRIDEEPGEVPSVLLPKKTKQYDAIVVSDYCKGTIDHQGIMQLCKKASVPIFVDTKMPNLVYFPNSFVKVNQKESKELYNIDDSTEIITTLGSEGASWCGNIFTGPKVDVFDVTGAGDVFLASLCYFYLATEDLEAAIQASVYLASKSVQHMGTYTLTEEDINEIYI